ncbi:hypothetical protein QZM18_06560 [Burkholderia diffusa]|nr:hypothetical protein [Burkholderia diffusa]
MATLRILSIDAVQKAASCHPERGRTRRVSKRRSVRSASLTVGEDGATPCS